MRGFAFAAAVLASPLTFAGGFLDLGHMDWAMLLAGGYAETSASLTSPAATELHPRTNPLMQRVPGRVAADGLPSIADLNFTTGASRLTSPGASP